MADAIMQSREAAAERLKRAPLVTSNRTMSWITDHVASVTEKSAPKWWWIAFTLSSSLAMVSVFCIG